ncbi:hypothetical protein STEG23_028211 [Scotinomys teguina]
MFVAWEEGAKPHPGILLSSSKGALTTQTLAHGMDDLLCNGLREALVDLDQGALQWVRCAMRVPVYGMDQRRTGKLALVRQS